MSDFKRREEKPLDSLKQKIKKNLQEYRENSGGPSLIEMKVKSVRIHPPTNRRVVILQEIKKERYIFIWVGETDAYEIALKHQDNSPEHLPRPHALLLNIIRGLD